MTRYLRNMQGYGPNPPAANWPGGAKIAVQFVVNYEEGGENCVLHDDAASEAFLSEIVGAQPWPGQRHWNMESMYEYGARAGFWRVHRLFTGADIPVTVYGVATALERSPQQVAAMQSANWEIASHGLKWIDYKDFSKTDERKHMLEAIAIHRHVTGERPRGWYTGRASANTVDLVSEEGGFSYCSDTYDDDLPYWRSHAGHEQLIIPYTLDVNDMRFVAAQGFNSGEQFFTYLKDSFDALYDEGLEGTPKMMTIGLHCRLIGRPGRIQSLKRFVEYIKTKSDVWFARRIDIAEHWRTNHPVQGHEQKQGQDPGQAQRQGLSPTGLDKAAFVQAYGGIFEHSPWIAEAAYGLELGPAHNTAIGLHSALCRVFRAAGEDLQLGVLKAHPDLAGKLADAKQLTKESTAEQASAGLDALTAKERETFTSLNTEYVSKFDFPFIIAVRGLSKDDILTAFKVRIHNVRETEIVTACREVERIALLRLKDILP